MNLDLSGKQALVSGSTAGIGLAVSTELARLGADVWINGRSEQRVADAIATIRQGQPEARLHAAPGDLTTAEGADQLLATVDAVDILVNNVGGVTAFKPFEQLDDEDWRRVFEVNVISGARLTRRYLPSMRSRGWGRVVFIASESAVHIPPEFLHYGAAKAAVVGMARGIAETLLGGAVTVNSVLAGPTMSEALARAAAARGISQEQFEREMIAQRRSTSLLKRFTTLEEVASMVSFLCSPAASGTHGAALRVEGGIIKSAF
jgi:NAD(P)-dependent dehydrogenase (short-subunit alcohol dehydrogenase family)